MTQKEIKELKIKIDKHKETLYDMNIEIDLIYGVIETFSRTNLSEKMIETWLKGMEYKFDIVKNAIKEIEGDSL